MAVLDATNLAVSFTAPASGAVTARLSGEAVLNSSGYAASQYQAWAVFSGGSQVGPQAIAYSPLSAAGAINVGAIVDIDVVGLTPGSAYVFDWAAYAVSSDARIYVGSGVNLGSNNLPAVMKVYAA